MGEVGDLGEEGVVPAGGLCAALDDVTGGHRTRERVVIRWRPAEVGRGGADDHRRVGDATRHHHVGAVAQAVGDAPRPEVRVGRQWCAPARCRRHCGSETQLLGAPDQVVTLDVGDVDRKTEPLGQRPHRGGQPGGVQPTRVGDDPHTAIERSAQAVFELGQECLGVAAVRRLGAVAGQNQHGQLGEVVAGQVVQVAAGKHLAHRRQPVAVEARAVADADGTRRTR